GPSESPSMAPTVMPTLTPTAPTTDDDQTATAESAARTTTSAETTSPTLSSSASSSSSLWGTILLGQFLVDTQVRIGSTKCELFQCHHVSDVVDKKHPLMIKLSTNIPQMILEHRIYKDLFARLSLDQQQLFVRVYDWIPASDLTEGRVGFVMEAGLENLRGIVWRNGPMTGLTLQQAMKRLLQTIHALHQLGVVWTEVKAENFVVMPNGNIKAIDLESVAAKGEFLRCYSAETYPPEFPPDSLYQGLPQIPLEYSFDLWGLGLVLLEMAIGEPLFTLQNTYNVDYVRDRLKNPQGIVDEAKQRLEAAVVDPLARDIILQCLVVDPTERSTCEQLLNHEYFQT
ncbi:MAG: hypothetical protein SGBAC_009534, partial [Bacillariaceae sp.]